jgi:hypothetical protein
MRWEIPYDEGGDSKKEKGDAPDWDKDPWAGGDTFFTDRV